MTGERPSQAATLVLGLPGLVATRVVEALTARGQSVLGVVRSGERWSPPPGVEVVLADPCAIDLGLSGADYSGLCVRAERIVCAMDPVLSAGTLERAPPVRAAAELLELVRAGAGQRGVVYSSSLFVFGDAAGPVAETEFEVGQDFPTPLEEALAVAEKLVRRGQGLVPLSVVRAAPVAGDAGRSQLLPTSPLSRLAERIRLSPGAIDYEFSDQPVRFETAERLAEVLVRCWSSPGARTLHLVDRPGLTDRQLVRWLAERIGRPLAPPPTGMRLRPRWRLPETPLARSILGFRSDFERTAAEAFCPDLLDADPARALGAFFPGATQPEPGTDASAPAGGGS